MRQSMLALLLLSVALAGCTDGAGPQSVDDAQIAEVDAGAGADEAVEIRGFVVDDEELPVSGATVAVLGTELVTTTGADGAFAFRNLPAGRYNLAAQRLGYESNVVGVDAMEVGALYDMRIPLTPIVIAEPYQDTFGPFTGRFECRWGLPFNAGNCGWVCALACGPNPGSVLFPNDNSIQRYEFTSDDYRTVVGDMRWTQGTAATSTELRFAFSYDGRVGSHWWCSGEGPSPLQWRFQKLEADDDPECFGASVGGTRDPDEPSTEHVLRTYANVPFGRATQGEPVFIALQQNFEIMTTVFYVEPGPESYTAFSDA